VKASAVGVAWYRREDYPRLLTIFDDADKLPRTYDECLVIAEKAFQSIEKAGAFAFKAIIDPDDFPKWCAANGYNVDAEARMEFANREATRQYRKRN
jgi:hypothetical protein